MSTFAVKVRKIEILPHPNADALELAQVDDYRCVVKKDQYKSGDLVVYIPEAAIVPEWILKQYNFWNEKENKGMLSGPEGNRVKAIKLRGELSQGIVIPVITDYPHSLPYGQCAVRNEHDEDVFMNIGEDVAKWLGITKYEPPIPVHMAGEVFNAGSHLTVNYDIENFKAFPTVLQDHEEVVITEKLHGTFCQVVIVPEKDANENMFHGRILVASKGLGAQGLCFKANEQNETNVYVRALKASGLFDKLLNQFSVFFGENGPIPFFVLGEVYGPGVQDGFSYGNDLKFRVFDMGYGYRGEQRYLNWNMVKENTKLLKVETVPELYVGPFSKEKMLELTSGKETVSGESKHMREGVVVKPTTERRDFNLGRVILKSVSEEYLTRKGGTEYN